MRLNSEKIVSRKIHAPVETRDTRDTRYLSNTTPKERSLVELGYDKVMREDGGEDLVLTDASRYTMIADSPDDLEKKVYDNLSLDVFLDKDLLRTRTLNLKFDIERLRALENATKVEAPEPGAVLTNANLTELCRKKLIRYGRVLEQNEKIKPKSLDPEFKVDYLKGIVMWLLTGSYKTVPADLQYKWTSDKSIRPHHQRTVSGRTAERKEVTKEAK
ncbi:hypothetical protein FOZ60_006127 [Perkinsus olseni]|uniref:Uncharacterized protein n=1 Tax=Perkinsus olseni TaxID=32597 RepID=A0A7J6PFL0_PEROL|nr:hypothetical protein FOZ60_006127 [Perkinsus olseni]